MFFFMIMNILGFHSFLSWMCLVQATALKFHWFVCENFVNCLFFTLIHIM